MAKTDIDAARWLLLAMRLPATHSSERVSIWRQLRTCGALPLGSAGYVLPNSPSNRERFEWLSLAVRGHKGKASIAEVRSFDDISTKDLEKRFRTARENEYAALIRDIKKLIDSKHTIRSESLRRLRQRFADIVAVDFFTCPEQKQIEKLFAITEAPVRTLTTPRKRFSAKDYAGRVWVTRPRPGIDRVGSAWLIRRFIDPKSKFVFSAAPDHYPEAIPFDMYGGIGFGHEAEGCTFETLLRSFAIKDRRALRIAQAIHDADIGDAKYGNPEALGIERVLVGWDSQGLSDDELLARGIDLMEGLYRSIE
jgi:hypothetical protein